MASVEAPNKPITKGGTAVGPSKHAGAVSEDPVLKFGANMSLGKSLSSLDTTGIQHLLDERITDDASACGKRKYVPLTQESYDGSAKRVLNTKNMP